MKAHNCGGAGLYNCLKAELQTNNRLKAELQTNNRLKAELQTKIYGGAGIP